MLNICLLSRFREYAKVSSSLGKSAACKQSSIVLNRTEVYGDLTQTELAVETATIHKSVAASQKITAFRYLDR